MNVYARGPTTRARVPEFVLSETVGDRPTDSFVRSFDMMIRCSRDSIECVGLEKESIIVEHWIPFPFRALTHACAAAAAAAAV